LLVAIFLQFNLIPEFCTTLLISGC